MHSTHTPQTILPLQQTATARYCFKENRDVFSRGIDGVYLVRNSLISVITVGEEDDKRKKNSKLGEALC